MVIYDILFHLFPTFSPLPHPPKITRLKNIYISTRNYYLSEKNFSLIWRNTLGHLLLYTMADYTVCFKVITNIIPSNTIPQMVVPLGRIKGYIQQLRNFNHRGKDKIGCYPKYFLIFTSYQVQGRCTIIIKPVKS